MRLNMKKIAIALLLALALLSINLSSTEVATTNEHPIFNKNLLKGAALAEIAHVISEYLIVHFHEEGHNIAAKLTTGVAGTVHIFPTFNPLVPFAGHTALEKSTNVIIAAGPYAGIMAIYATIIGMEMVHAYTDGKSITFGFINGLKKPISIYSDIIHKVKEMIANPDIKKLTILSSFFGTFALLKSGRLIGEILYGFTPLYPSWSDGARLWSYSLTTDWSAADAICTALTLTPALISGIIGIYKGIKENQLNAAQA